MFHRRRDDAALTATPAAPDAALPRMAVSWLRDLLRTEFADDPFPPAEFRAGATEAPSPAGGEDAADEAAALAVWRREWLRRWRRLQLPEQLAAFGEALEAARAEADVHRALAAHAAPVVGAQVCLVFLPGPGERLEPLPEPRVETDGLWLGARAADGAQVVTAHEAAARPALAGVAALFGRAHAAALAVAPYGGGAAVLVERRSERAYEQVDLALLGVMCGQADAALGRVRLLAAAGDAPGGRLDEVLRHAWAGAALGHPVTFVVVRVDGDTGDGAAACEAVLRRELAGAGPVLRTGPRELVVALHGDRAAADGLMGRVRARWDGRAPLRAGIVPHDPAAGSARELLRRARALVE